MYLYDISRCNQDLAERIIIMLRVLFTPKQLYHIKYILIKFKDLRSLSRVLYKVSQKSEFQKDNNVSKYLK